MAQDATGVVRASDDLSFAAKSVILLGGVLASMALMAITSVLPMIETDLAHSAQDRLLVKQLVGGVGLAMVVGAPLGGVLVDKFGLRRTMIFGALIYTIAGTAGFYLDTLPSLLASRLVLGVAAASIQIMSLSLINTRLHGAARAKWMGIHISVAMFGTIVVHPVAGLLGEMGWRWPFILYGTGIVLVLAMLLSKDPLSENASKPRRERDNLFSWFPLHYPPLAICVGAVVYLPMIYTPFLLRSVSDVSPSVISLVLTADSLIGALMALMYGRARSRLSAHGAFIFSFTVIGLGTLVAALSTGFFGIVAGMVIYGFGVGWLVPNLMISLSTKVSSERQGRAAGIVKAAHFLAAPLAVVVMEPFAHRFGPQNALLAVTGLSFVLFLAIVFRTLQSKKTASEDPMVSVSAGAEASSSAPAE